MSKYSSKGGMQAVGVNASLICPKCGKASYKMTDASDGKTYYHFTKNGTKTHFISDVAGRLAI